MPIRPELRKFYGRDWRNYRAALIARRGSRCAECRREVLRYLNLSHTTHNPLTSSVRLLCASCHSRHDAAHSFAAARRTRARRVGQLWLLPDLEKQEIETQRAREPEQARLFA